jgi:hypothetical protein
MHLALLLLLLLSPYSCCLCCFCRIAAGFVEAGPANLVALTEGIHSKEALELVHEHMPSKPLRECGVTNLLLLLLLLLHCRRLDGGWSCQPGRAD